MEKITKVLDKAINDLEKLRINVVVGSETELLCVDIGNATWLTYLKKYTLIDEEEENYLVKGDEGFKNWYSKTMFEVIETQ
tara:strand:- start:1254 stop:1496 length:243 start_codon:yes stop_codon:yes gene_type:complete